MHAKTPQWSLGCTKKPLLSCIVSTPQDAGEHISRDNLCIFWKMAETKKA